MSTSPIHRKFNDALEALVDEVKADRSVLAAILCGSLSHDTVWAKSDIDLILVTIDDSKVESGSLPLYVDGLNVHAMLIPRTPFRKLVEGSLRNSFMHSLLLKGRLLYTHDQTIADLFAGLSGIGERDTRVQLLNAATTALPTLYKAHKWFITRGDLDYTALWILYTATALAQIEVIAARQLVDREVIQKATTLNPELFATIYTGLLNEKKSKRSVRAALDAIDAYLAQRAPNLFAPVIDYLREAEEARSCTEIEAYFRKHFAVEGTVTACEYLADQGLIGKASTPVHLTKKSNIEVQELAFFFMTDPPDEF